MPSLSTTTTMEIVHQCQVSPPPESIPEPVSSLPLTFFDIAFLDMHPTERCFFYHLPSISTPHFIKSYLPTLNSSLSLTLGRFYPLAGRLVPSPHSDQHFALRYTQGDSVPFTVYESIDDDFLDLTGSHPRKLSRLRRLVPQLSASEDACKPLLSIQITLFPNHGICIGVTISHIACDGFSFNHFVKSWAAACKSSDITSMIPPPSFDRSALVSCHDIYSSSIGVLKKLRPTEASVAARLNDDELETVGATVRLGSEHIKRLKQLVQSSTHTSAFVVTCAYLLTCSAKLQQESMFNFLLIANWRNQLLQTQTPLMYFGNCLLFRILPMKAGDIMRDDGLKVASETIGKAIEETKEGTYTVLQQEKVTLTAPMIIFSGSPRFKVYETDFGWGRPVKVEMVTINRRAVVLAESREEAGGVEIGLFRPKHEMEEFLAIFNKGLELL